MLGSKLEWILSGRTTTEPSMLTITCGKDINRETTLMTNTHYSLRLKPMADFGRLESIGIQDSPTEDAVFAKSFSTDAGRLSL